MVLPFTLGKSEGLHDGTGGSWNKAEGPIVLGDDAACVLVLHGVALEVDEELGEESGVLSVGCGHIVEVTVGFDGVFPVVPSALIDVQGILEGVTDEWSVGGGVSGGWHESWESGHSLAKK